ncbi:hypothetical protein P167DRAFT_532183 [Morchella conica CCBAS932]|uniref:Uncharacterized protein n=1 Tax=Morchella conica CCBAS932 TaxID=1392247 RepID=A0A3N4L1E9_9PEZI|nr:hypothetical protein P167DRAFT_532183 [Morchella conica CCBAS932]
MAYAMLCYAMLCYAMLCSLCSQVCGAEEGYVQGGRKVPEGVLAEIVIGVAYHQSGVPVFSTLIFRVAGCGGCIYIM